MAPSVLLLGAGGALGAPLVQEFIRQKSRFSKIGILVTDPSKRAKFAEPAKQGIELVEGGLLDSNSYKGFEYVISLVGNALLRLQPAMIDLAYAAGVKHFYPSEFGIDLGQDFTYLHRYFRSKQDTRIHLIAKARDNSDFKYTLLMCGGFIEWATFFLDDKTKTFTQYGDNPDDASWDVTSIPDVCRYTVDSIFLSQGEQKRVIKVRGERTTVRGVADAIGKAKSIDVTIKTLDPKIAEEKSLQAFKNGDEPGEFSWALLSFITRGQGILTGELCNDQFDFKPETLDEGLRRYYGVN